jgi:hypothetical protein
MRFLQGAFVQGAVVRFRALSMRMDLVGLLEFESWWKPAYRRNLIKEIVMAKVIEFYIPTDFRKPVKLAPQLQCGKLIEFCLQKRKSA